MRNISKILASIMGFSGTG